MEVALVESNQIGTGNPLHAGHGRLPSQGMPLVDLPPETVPRQFPGKIVAAADRLRHPFFGQIKTFPVQQGAPQQIVQQCQALIQILPAQGQFEMGGIGVGGHGQIRCHALQQIVKSIGSVAPGPAAAQSGGKKRAEPDLPIGINQGPAIHHGADADQWEFTVFEKKNADAVGGPEPVHGGELENQRL